MSGQYLTIEKKERQSPGFLADLADFSVTAGDTVSADIVCANSNISLYCLDDASKRAIFVEQAPDIDLAKVPFVYQTQYEHTQRLVALPYDSFVQVAHDLPPVRHLIMIYMTGRCGSTLLSHVLNEVDGVLSLSEPDVATQFVHLRGAYVGRESELQQLLDCTVRILFKPTMHKTPLVYALKLRSEGTQVMDLYQATFPTAKNLFLYRDAIGWVTSFYRIFSRGGAPERMPLDEVRRSFDVLYRYDATHLAALLEQDATEVSLVQYLTLWWLATMEWYLAKHSQGYPVLAARYADLNARREEVLTAIFAYCGLPTSKVSETLGVFARDSQAGTFLAREKPDQGNTLQLSAAQHNEVAQILSHHPTITESDFIAPATLR
ncbi:MAG TPA: hypothetical protein VFU22_20875 [Roseiflexaceae bacterium]|nr:hypothetical protein [Roseiflexaceae bacterium]